jgi:hypothetical protein
MDILDAFSELVDLSTPAAREEIPLKIEIDVEDPTGKTTEYRSVAAIPRAVIDGANNDFAKVGMKLLNDILSYVMTDLLQRGPWTCWGCHERATKFVFNISSYFNKQPPFLKDVMCRPICAKPECYARTHKECQDIYKSAGKLLPTKEARKEHRAVNANRSSCANCKKQRADVAKLMTCGRCKLVWYCSQKCQRKHWKEHKKMCVDVSK